MKPRFLDLQQSCCLKLAEDPSGASADNIHFCTHFLSQPGHPTAMMEKVSYARAGGRKHQLLTSQSIFLKHPLMPGKVRTRKVSVSLSVFTIYVHVCVVVCMCGGPEGNVENCPPLFSFPDRVSS